MSSSKFKQDLPPKGGYAPVAFKRIPARQLVNAPLLFGGQVALFLIAWPMYAKARRRFEDHKIEMKSAQFALQPMLLAERDRTFLKELRVNRDWEEEVMKDVPGWEVGTWFGEQVYKTSNKWMDPLWDEYVAYCRPIAQNKERTRKYRVSG
ncbi:NADH dehydrogenase [ubiquinone] 1 alpha subcomplex subunit 13 [Lepeophtheirus salmonis]|uniref:NADH dehydrogenase [ubiquinone] 1 alpha subcomplex subunit 13 n=1 Tax=Lepeophtheirus salmonis TaxID=72036 RepID=UPI001AE5AF36|nr:NADH dehydrogenase [ubiquinone] 1 alpha subcomplex subunit 13-like [Lepeophtheirus salmonis]